MKNPNKAISIIMPALNEEKSISAAISDTLSAFKEFGIDGEIIVINDGSTDSTPQLIQKAMDSNPGLVRTINHDSACGVGVCFRDGIKNANGEFVCMLPGDNENLPGEILRYVKLMEDVDIVVPLVHLSSARPY